MSAIVGLVVARSGLVTAEQLGPLVADMEVAAAPDPMVAVAPSSLDGLPAVDHAGLRVALIEARAVSSNSAGQPIVVADLAEHLVDLDHLDRRARRIQPQVLAQPVDDADVQTGLESAAEVDR